MNLSIKQVSTRADTPRRSAWHLRARAIGAAMVVTTIILMIGRGVNGEFPMTTSGSGTQTVGLTQTIVVTGLAGLAAWGLLVLLELRTARANAIWTAIAVTVLALSLLGPLGNGANASSKVVLACMHIGAAMTLILLMRRSSATEEGTHPGALPSLAATTK
jgi:hypothetical protein